MLGALLERVAAPVRQDTYAAMTSAAENRSRRLVSEIRRAVAMARIPPKQSSHQHLVQLLFD
jgi:hypothetical protein